MLLVLAGALLSATPATAADRNFVFIFSSQSCPKLPRFTHVWASMVKVTGADLPFTQRTLQLDTISWFPATLSVHTFRLRPEPGINLDLHATLEQVQHQHQHVSVWGPFEVPEFIYCEFMMQKARLESGQVLYQAIDSLRPPERVSDCIHSLTDMDRQHGRSAYPLNRFGDDAAAGFVRVIKERGGAVPEGEFVELAYQALDLRCYSVMRRDCTSGKHSRFGGAIVKGSH
jgi:hypothetical protein